MTDLFRRYWIASETKSQRLFEAFVIAMFLCGIIGVARQWDFLIGMSFAFGAFALIQLPAQMRRRKF